MMTLTRRDVLGGVAGLTLAQGLSASPTYRVGLKYGNDPYQTTLAAIASSGEFPNVTGKTVVIKPNLVVGVGASTGVTTDPAVVRAVVDLCLQLRARKVVIVEASGLAGGPAAFEACGYTFFDSYDPRVATFDLANDPLVMVSNPQGYLYQQLFVPKIVTKPRAVWISVAKMKAHVLSTVTLNVKNLFGLFSPAKYRYEDGRDFMPRTDPHEYGMDQTINEMALVRPVHYSVIDGIVGMQGFGPLYGTPIQSNVVVAAANSVAGDRVATEIMDLAQQRVVHLAYAAISGLGPAGMPDIEIVGDPLIKTPYEPAKQVYPVTLPPSHTPVVTSPGAEGLLSYRVPAGFASLGRLEILSNSNISPDVVVKRVLFDWQPVEEGTHDLVWDGLDEEGAPLPPGRYFVRLLTGYEESPPVRVAANSASKAFWVV